MRSHPIIGLVAASALALGSCGGHDLPPGWEDAHELAVSQRLCVSDPYNGKTSERLELSVTGDDIAAAYREAHFRCEQRVCGYRLDRGSTTKVLMQPCDMDPTAVASCDCLYDIDFGLKKGSDLQTVELYRRWDNLNHPNDPVLIDAEAVPTQ